MKRLILLLLLAVSIIGTQAIINCSKPLDSNTIIPDPDPDPNARDTVYVFDTLFLTDTIVTVDTIFGDDTTIIYDTIIMADTVVDTVVQVDTVIIIDTLFISPAYCANLSTCQKTITWLLQNHAGGYHLEFAASGDVNDPKEVLIVEINGEEIKWRPYDDPELILDLDLPEDSKAFIYSLAPHAFGHAMAICLKLEEQ